jgi:site-specific DNA recombinase
VIAADYIRNLREETIKGINGRLKQGLYPFSAPIGYLNNGGGKPKTPDPIRAPLIRKMFELYAAREYSVRSLHVEMKARGLRNQRGKPISLCGVETILNNPFYTGLIRLKSSGRMYEGVHEPIVPATLFKRVQDIKVGKYGKKTTKHNHLFRGLFRCGNCGSPMSPEVQKGNVYYRCHTKTCLTKTIREEEIETAIIDTLKKLQISEDDHAKLIQGLDHWYAEKAEVSDLENTLNVQISQVKNRIERLTDALVDRLIEKDIYNQHMQSLLLEKAEIEERANQNQKFETDLLNLKKFLELLKNLVVIPTRLIIDLWWPNSELLLI